MSQKSTPPHLKHTNKADSKTKASGLKHEVQILLVEEIVELFRDEMVTKKLASRTHMEEM